MNLNSFLNFDNFITPKFITIIYWIILAVVVLSGIALMFSGQGFAGFLMGLACILFGVLFTRIYCELLMVVFSMNNYLKKISEKTDI